MYKDKYTLYDQITEENMKEVLKKSLNIKFLMPIGIVIWRE